MGLKLNLDTPDRQELPIKYLVPGDVIFLAAGDMIPADVRLMAAKDLFVNSGALTGESLPVEKQPRLPSDQEQMQNPLELANICFLAQTSLVAQEPCCCDRNGQQHLPGNLSENCDGS
jgi:Mg2+-importing ATPase